MPIRRQQVGEAPRRHVRSPGRDQVACAFSDRHIAGFRGEFRVGYETALHSISIRFGRLDFQDVAVRMRTADPEDLHIDGAPAGIRTPNQQIMRRFEGHQQGETKPDVAVFTESAAVKVRYIVINVRTEDRGLTARRTSLDRMS